MKGKQVYVEGRLQTRKWQDRDGTDRYTTEINAFSVVLLGGGGGGRSGGARSTSDVGGEIEGDPITDSTDVAGEPIGEDDIPF